MWTKGEGMWVRARACRGHVGGGGYEGEGGHEGTHITSQHCVPKMDVLKHP